MASQSHAIVERRLRNLVTQLKYDGCETSLRQQSAVVCLEHTRARQPSGSKLVDAGAAAALVQAGDTLTISGFVGCVCPDLLLSALRQRFDSTGQPRGLNLVFPVSASDGKGRGLDRLAVEGLVSKVVYSWAGNCPGLAGLIREGKVQAWNLPLGAISHMIRDTCAGRLGPITRIGLGTFVDPRIQGGRLNDVTTQHLVEVVQIGGKELLWYKAPKRIDIALIRGSTADTEGNISMEREPVLLDVLHQAMAAHNSGGRVIVQVERVVAAGSLAPRAVHIPGVLVDKVVLAPEQSHPMTFGSPRHDGFLTGELISPPGHEAAALGLEGNAAARRVIAHRALLEVGPGTRVVNLGVGMPEGVASMVASHGHQVGDHVAGLQLTVESGTFGGHPQSGPGFGTTRDATSYTPTATMLDFYSGSGIDAAFLGMAECDQGGNVNVSRFGSRMPGCGGFIDISQTAKKVIFLGTFTAGGLQVAVCDGKLIIKREGRERKFCSRVQEMTFASATSPANRPVRYVTERAVFGLLPGGDTGGGGLQLLEVAPGLDVERDILAHMDFRPVVVPGEVRVMDLRIFRDDDAQEDS